VTLKSGSEVTQGHWKWYHSIDWIWFPVFFSNFVPKMPNFSDIRFQKCRDLENRVNGSSRSLEMSPFDRAHVTSYWRSIVTMALYRVVSDIFNVEKCCDLEIGVKPWLASRLSFRRHAGSAEPDRIGSAYTSAWLSLRGSSEQNHAIVVYSGSQHRRRSFWLTLAA